MKIFSVVLSLLVLTGCGFAGKVKRMNDDRLCQTFGEYSLYDHAEAMRLTKEEITRRNIDTPRCENMANSEIDRMSSEYKLRLCQNLASFHYQGAYPNFNTTLDKIEKAGFADEECNTMADFFLIKLSRKQEKAKAISNAINQASENMRRNNEALYGKGTTFNPIHVKIQ